MIYKYKVTGMHCDACARKVKKSVEDIAGVKSVNVLLKDNSLSIDTNTEISLSDLNATLTRYKGAYSIDKWSESLFPSWFGQYKPVIIIYLGVIIFTLIRAVLDNNFSFEMLMADFMGAFFVTFSFFKLINLKNFSVSYARYDIVAKYFPIYGYIYPFIELVLGTAFLFRYQMYWASVATLVVMGIGSIGVIQALRSKRIIECACLGGFFKLPMSKVALFEDLSMVFMAVLMLITN